MDLNQELSLTAQRNVESELCGLWIKWLQKERREGEKGQENAKKSRKSEKEQKEWKWAEGVKKSGKERITEGKKDENHQRTLQNCKKKRYRAPKKPE